MGREFLDEAQHRAAQFVFVAWSVGLEPWSLIASFQIAQIFEQRWLKLENFAHIDLLAQTLRRGLLARACCSSILIQPRMRDVLQKVVIGITGASGAVLGVRTVEAFAAAGVETHLVVSKWGQQTLEHETALKLDNLRDRATQLYSSGDMAAAISSGSFRTMGMVIAPCSMHSLAAISLGMGKNLVHRAADVVLKERLPLVLVPRETPLNDVHLENMLRLSRMGVRILPPNPAFYNHPESVEDIVDHIVSRILDQFGVAAEISRRWDGSIRREQ